MTETMTADDAKICRIRASDKTRHDADIFERAEATFHALAKQWAESERLRNALAASQQEVERLKADRDKVARDCGVALYEVERLKGKLELADTFADAQLTDIGRLRTQLAAAREDSARMAKDVHHFRQRGDEQFARAEALKATLYALRGDTARSTDAERTHGETR